MVLSEGSYMYQSGEVMILIKSLKNHCLCHTFFCAFLGFPNLCIHILVQKLCCSCNGEYQITISPKIYFSKVYQGPSVSSPNTGFSVGKLPFYFWPETRSRKNVQTMEIINNIYWLVGRSPKRQD